MSDEHENSSEPLTPDASSPPVEDAAEPEPVQEVVDDDDPDLLEGAARSLDGGESEGESAPAPASIVDETEGDTDAILDDTPEATGLTASAKLSADAIAHQVAIELKQVEQEVRTLLEAGDPRRKRKLSGSRRWRELEEDIINWHHTGRFSQESLMQLQQLIVRRHQLFHHLAYLASTRPTWNS